MTKDQIIASTNDKHVKIYLLKQQGLKNSEIARELGTNAGHVYNVLKEYSQKPERAENALRIANNGIKS